MGIVRLILAIAVVFAHTQLSPFLTGRGGSLGNRPLEPRALEVEFFPMEEVLHEKVKIH